MILKRSTQPLRPLRLDILGGEELKEPNRFVWRDTAAMGMVVDAIASERTYPIRLSRLSDNPCVAEELVARFKKAGWITRTLNMPYPYLRLRADSISKSLREDLRRARRKAERRGPVGFEVAQGNEADLQRALAIQACGWKGRNRTAILSSPARTRFFESYGRSAAADGTLRLSFLTIGGKPVAVHFGIESADAYWLLFIGFNEDYRECSPGMLLLEETIGDCARRGLARYNFLGKEEPWIRRWSAEAQDCLVLAAYRPNIQGAIAVLSDALYLLNNRRKAARVKKAKMTGRLAASS
jgi:CelD/BcsL family acetyltransferase involved in cellulose biosynthesis